MSVFFFVDDDLLFYFFIEIATRIQCQRSVRYIAPAAVLSWTVYRYVPQVCSLSSGSDTVGGSCRYGSCRFLLPIAL